MRRMIKGRSQKTGLPPGSLFVSADTPAGATRITAIDYDETRVRDVELQSVGDCGSFANSSSVTWLNVDQVSDAALVESLGNTLGFHPLMQEDILSADQRTKIEDHGEHVFIALKMLSWSDTEQTVASEQLCIVLGARYVLSFQERQGDCFDPLRARIRQGAGRVRRQGADYLAYCLLDLTIDRYFVVLEKLGERIERVEEDVMTRPRPNTLKEIHHLKRELIVMRKSVWPVREMVSSLRHLRSPLVHDGMQPYLRDLQDHVEQVIEGLAAYQDLLSDTVATYLSTQSNRTNAIMKVLAVFSAVFMPLTFITGVFGMNFHRMPLVGWDWGFAATLATMIALGGLMAAFFFQKRWL